MVPCESHRRKEQVEGKRGSHLKLIPGLCLPFLLLVALTWTTVMWNHLYCVWLTKTSVSVKISHFIFCLLLYMPFIQDIFFGPFPIDKDFCECQNVSLHFSFAPLSTYISRILWVSECLILFSVCFFMSFIQRPPSVKMSQFILHLLLYMSFLHRPLHFLPLFQLTRTSVSVKMSQFILSLLLYM